MSTKRITIQLTKAEADALWHAAGEALTFPDIAESVFPGTQDRKAAYRAWKKLRAAAFQR